jgi:hypothetical protein
MRRLVWAVLATAGIATWGCTRSEPELQPPAEAAKDVRLEARRQCWQLGKELGNAAAGMAQDANFEFVRARLDECGPLAKSLGVEMPVFPWTEGGSKAAIGPAARFYTADAATNHRGGGRVLEEAIREKHGDEAAATYSLAFKSTFFRFFYPDDGKLADLGQARGIVESIIDELQKSGETSPVPRELWEPVVAALRGEQPFRVVNSAVVRMHSMVGWHFDDLVDPPTAPDKLSGISEQSFAAIWLDASDLPSGLERTESYRKGPRETMGPGDELFQPLGGARSGLNVWIDNDAAHTISRIVDIRWVFHDDTSAERYLRGSLPTLSEGEPQMDPPVRLEGATCFAYGGTPGRAARLLLGDKASQLKQYMFLIRKRNVVIKLFCSQSMDAREPLELAAVEKLARRAAERIDVAAEPPR